MLMNVSTQRIETNIAHRGIKNLENTIYGIQKANKTMQMVEFDIRYNTNRHIILCHDREDRNISENETLEQLCKIEDPMNLMIDIKAFGIEPATQIADDVFTIIGKYPQHKYYLCSFNEFCVKRLLDLREDGKKYKIGVISSGVPICMFDHLINIDFISLDYNIICEEIVELFHHKGKRVFAWTVNALEMQDYVVNICGVDGIIYDIFD
jgi:glycerophosphoryl diester phosphodiesterase